MIDCGEPVAQTAGLPPITANNNHKQQPFKEDTTMRLVDAVQRAIHEPEFANRLKTAARKAYPTPAGSNEWNEFLGFFAATPADLAALNTPVSAGAGPATPGIPTTTSLLVAAATSTN